MLAQKWPTTNVGFGIKEAPPATPQPLWNHICGEGRGGVCGRVHPPLHPPIVGIGVVGEEGVGELWICAQRNVDMSVVDLSIGDWKN